MVDPRGIVSGDVREFDGWSVERVDGDVFRFVREAHGIRVWVVCDVGKVIEYGLVLEDVLSDHMTCARSSSFSGVVVDYGRESAVDVVVGTGSHVEDEDVDFGLWEV